MRTITRMTKMNLPGKELNPTRTCRKCGLRQTKENNRWRCKPCAKVYRQTVYRERAIASTRAWEKRNPEAVRVIEARHATRRRDKAFDEFGARYQEVAMNRDSKTVATNHSKRWTDEEDRLLQGFVASGMTSYQSATSLGRTLCAVKARRQLLRGSRK